MNKLPKHLNKANVSSGIIGGVTGGLLVGVLLLVVTPFVLQPEPGETANTASGMPIITNYQCPMGETKQVFINGVEDNYSPQNTEPARMHSRLASLAGFFKVDAESRNYDETGSDKYLVDYFEIPSDITGGLFITKVKLPANNNDEMYIGDYLSNKIEGLQAHKHTHWQLFNNPENNTIWKKDGDLYSAQLSAMIFNSNTGDNEREYANLLDYIQSGEKQQIVDVLIGDDIVVDFTAMIVCQPPRVNRGVTLAEHSGFEGKLDGISFLSCFKDASQSRCDAIRGDTDCRQLRPLACFNDLNLPMPDIIQEDRYLSKHWVGGQVEFSEDVRGDTFQTIAEANEYCASQFGQTWRVLSLHESGHHASIAFTKTRKPEVRVWVDSKDENYPHTTCWAR